MHLDKKVNKMDRLSILIITIGLTLNLHGQKAVENISYDYSVINDWYISTSCDKYEDNSVKCKTDSVLIYTPIKYFIDNSSPTEEDTLMVLGYSTILNEIEEPKIYNQDFESDILRFCWFKDTLPVFYRIEKLNNEIKLTFKQTTGNFDINTGEIITNEKINISQKDYDKLIKTLESGDYWGMDTGFRIVGRTVLIESYLDNKYYFINKDWVDIKYNKTNKKILKCFDLLEKMID
jgi:hypothetical protein